MNSKYTKDQLKDLKKSYNMDVTYELEKVLAEEMAKSIDKEIIKDLFNLGNIDILVERTKSNIKRHIREKRLDQILGK